LRRKVVVIRKNLKEMTKIKGVAFKQNPVLCTNYYMEIIKMLMIV